MSYRLLQQAKPEARKTAPNMLFYILQLMKWIALAFKSVLDEILDIFLRKHISITVFINSWNKNCFQFLNSKAFVYDVNKARLQSFHL